MNNKRTRIGVDIDGVLIDMDPQAYLQFCERELGWSINYLAFKETQSWYAATGMESQEKIGEAFSRFITEVENSQHPIEGAHDALKKLGEAADIYLITARTGPLRRITEEFLKIHLPDVKYHELSMDNLERKAQRIINFGIDYYIDDSFREVALILEDKSINTTIIPFPAFHGTSRWQDFQDDRIHWLSAWDNIQKDTDPKLHPEIRKKAWEEIEQLIHKHNSSKLSAPANLRYA